jgi:hypothetical protein
MKQVVEARIGVRIELRRIELFVGAVEPGHRSSVRPIRAYCCAIKFVTPKERQRRSLARGAGYIRSRKPSPGSPAHATRVRGKGQSALRPGARRDCDGMPSEAGPQPPTPRFRKLGGVVLRGSTCALGTHWLAKRGQNRLLAGPGRSYEGSGSKRTLRAWTPLSAGCKAWCAPNRRYGASPQRGSRASSPRDRSPR